MVQSHKASHAQLRGNKINTFLSLKEKPTSTSCHHQHATLQTAGDGNKPELLDYI